MPIQPGRCEQGVFQFPVFDGQMISLANIAQQNCVRSRFATLLAILLSHGRSNNGKPHCVPGTFARSPVASPGITEIAETFENILCRNSAVVPWRCAVAIPAAAQRKSRRMWPAAIFYFRKRHEVRAGQDYFSQSSKLWERLIVISHDRPDQLLGSTFVVVLILDVSFRGILACHSDLLGLSFRSPWLVIPRSAVTRNLLFACAAKRGFSLRSKRTSGRATARLHLHTLWTASPHSTRS